MEVRSDLRHHLQYTPDAHGTVKALGIEEYPGEMVIVRELVQNADDAFDKKTKTFPTYIKFTITDKELIVEHDGKPFSKPPKRLLKKKKLLARERQELESCDFYRISKIGLGKTDEEMTGIFGTGFTSLFHVTDNPRIESNGWGFEIHIGDYPVINDIAKSRLTFIHLPFRPTKTKTSSRIGAEVFNDSKKQHLEQQVLPEAYKLIFFLKHIKRIEVSKGEHPLYEIRRIERTTRTNTKGLLCKSVTISVKNFKDPNWQDPEEKWAIYSLRNIRIPARLKELGMKLNQEVSIAISTSKTHFADQSHVPNYSYFTLPIKETGFHFKYNASKLWTTTDRTDFIKKEGLKNCWNEWQIDNIVELLLKVTAELTRHTKSPESIYGILPQPHEYLDSNDEYLINRFREKVIKTNAKIFFTTRKRWVGPKATYTGDKRLEAILPSSKIRNFADRRYYVKHPRLFIYYGLIPLDHKDVIRYLEENQGTNQFKERFDRGLSREKFDRSRILLEYLNSADLDLEEKRRLIAIDFILTEEGTLRSSTYRVYFPPHKSMPLMSGDDIVHHSIYSSKDSKSFLQQVLKITEIGLHDLIVDSFLRRLRHYSARQVLDFILYLARHKNEVTRNAETTDALKAQRMEFLDIEINDSDDPLICFSSEKLKYIFHNQLNYLSPQYEKVLARNDPDWKAFFKAIGVREIPSSEKIIATAQHIRNQGFSQKNETRAKELFELVSTNIDDLTEQERSKLREELVGLKWISTTSRVLEYPDCTYIDKGIRHLVGDKAPFLSFRVKKSDPLVKLLDMPSEPDLEDICSHLLNHSADVNNEADRKVDFRIYEYLNKNAHRLDSELGEELKNRLLTSRIIWHRGKLWNPTKLYLNSHHRQFGSNGEMRGYLHKSKLRELTHLCNYLGIQEHPRKPDSYIDFLLDISENSAEIRVSDWQKYIENACQEIINSEDFLTADKKDALGKGRIIIFDSYLLRPDDCYLLRSTDMTYKDKLDSSGIVGVPLILEDDPRKTRFYLSVGMKEIYQGFIQSRADDNSMSTSAEWEKRIKGLLPWILGCVYQKNGAITIASLDMFEKIRVQTVPGLMVCNGIRYQGEDILGNPVPDICCLELGNDGESLLYLDRSFDVNNDAQLSFLSELMANLIGPDIDIERFSLVLLVLQYLRNGKIAGVNPYYYPTSVRETEGPKEQEAEEEEETEETEVGKESEEKQEGIGGVDEGGVAEDRAKEKWPEYPKEKTSEIIGEGEADDGLVQPEKMGRKVSPKKVGKYSTPSSRGGGAPTPHARNYEEERKWVSKEAEDFCQVCILFCEGCNVKNHSEPCQCEIRKNAEKALIFHHLDAYRGDPTRDVRGNLVMLCAYHHKQLDGINLRLGYIRNKVITEEVKDGTILNVFPKDKDETEIRIKLSKDHFTEFLKYVRERSIKK